MQIKPGTYYTDKGRWRVESSICKGEVLIKNTVKNINGKRIVKTKQVKI